MVAGITSTPFAPPFIPTNIAGCQLWLRADMGITLNSSNKVTQWVDQSSNGYVFTSNGSGITYTKNDPVFGYQPTLSVVSGGSYLTSTTNFTLAQPFTIIFAINSPGTYTSANAGVLGTEVTGYPSISIQGVTGGNSYIGMDMGNSNYVQTNAPTYLQHNAVATVWNGGSSTMYINTSAAAFSPLAVFSPNTVGFGADVLHIFANVFNTHAISPGTYSEFIIYNSVLSQQQLSTVFQYLGARYGGNWS